jgi:hypothetical protein
MRANLAWGIIFAGCLALGMTVGQAAGTEKIITGLELEAMIAQAPEANPCRLDLGPNAVVVDPVAIYVEMPDGQISEGIVNMVHFEFRREGMEERIQFYSTPISQTQAVDNYPGCYRFPYAPTPPMSKDGTTKYFGRSRLSHTARPEIFGEWVAATSPFVLSARPILAHRMVFGRS